MAPHIRKICLLVFLYLIGLNSYASTVKKIVFFENTEFPLACYFLKGDTPGPTIMVQGGIQGDEICGVMTAETLIKCKVKKGNLIVVPRANLPSILHRVRGINVDLNRRFDKNYNKFYEDHLAKAIKLIASFSDGLIHLHEGSGFYCPVYIDILRNPKRYGQSFIIDTKEYKKKIKLEQIAKETQEEINKKIKNTHFKFNVFNTNTLSIHTQYPEQRKSLSFYTLTKLHRPAFAIEVSKDITDLKWKFKIQLKAAKLLLKNLGVEIEVPKNITHPIITEEFKNIRVLLDGKDITKKRYININEFSRFSIKNNKLSDDVIAILSNDLPFLNIMKLRYIPVSRLHSLYFSVYGKKIKQWKIKRGKRKIFSKNRDEFICQLNGKLFFIPPGDYLPAHEGDRLILLGTLEGTKNRVINLKGYVSRTGINSGQDIFSEIILNRDFFMKKYITFPLNNKRIWSCDVVKEDAPKHYFKVVVYPEPVPMLCIKNTKERFIVNLDSTHKIALPSGWYKLEVTSTPSHVILFKDNFPIKNGDNITINKQEVSEIRVVDTLLATIIGKIYLTGI